MDEWTEADAMRVLSDSPWAKPASFRTSEGETVTAVIRWDTARPVQAALHKVGLLPMTPDSRAGAAVAVVSFPRAWAVHHKDEVRRWQHAQAQLRATGSRTIPAHETRLLELDDDVPALAFVFAKSQDLLQPAAVRLPFFQKNVKRITVSVSLGTASIQCIFPLAAMMFRGAPEL